MTGNMINYSVPGGTPGGSGALVGITDALGANGSGDAGMTTQLANATSSGSEPLTQGPSAAVTSMENQVSQLYSQYNSNPGGQDYSSFAQQTTSLDYQIISSIMSSLQSTMENQSGVGSVGIMGGTVTTGGSGGTTGLPPTSPPTTGGSGGTGPITNPIITNLVNPPNFNNSNSPVGGSYATSNGWTPIPPGGPTGNVTYNGQTLALEIPPNMEAGGTGPVGNTGPTTFTGPLATLLGNYPPTQGSLQVTNDAVTNNPVISWTTSDGTQVNVTGCNGEVGPPKGMLRRNLNIPGDLSFSTALQDNTPAGAIQVANGRISWTTSNGSTVDFFGSDNCTANIVPKSTSPGGGTGSSSTSTSTGGGTVPNQIDSWFQDATSGNVSIAQRQSDIGSMITAYQGGTRSQAPGLNNALASAVAYLDNLNTAGVPQNQAWDAIASYANKQGHSIPMLDPGGMAPVMPYDLPPNWPAA